MIWAPLLLAALLCWSAISDEIKPRVVMQYTQWSVWGRRFCLSEFFKEGQFKGVTHIQYSFHYPDATCHIQTPDPDTDLGGEWWVPPCEAECPGEPVNRTKRSSNRGNIGCLKKISREMGIKIGISLGGWGVSTHFQKCVNKNEERKILIESLISQIREYEWDFVDIEWGYGSTGEDTVNDWADYKKFVKHLRQKLDNTEDLSNVEIAGSFNQHPDLIQGTGPVAFPTPMKWLCGHLDYVLLRSYDLMGGWNSLTGWPAPLHYDSAAPYHLAEELTVEWQLKTWKQACGVDFHKVLLGLPAYGRSWSSVDPGPSGTGVYQHCQNEVSDENPDDCLGEGSFADTAGSLEVWDIEALYLPNPNCTHYFHSIAKQDFVYCQNAMYPSETQKGKERLWFAFDGPETIYEKIKYAKELGAGGWAVWEASYTALGGDTDYSAMTDGKSEALQSARPALPTEYFWGPYEEAYWNAWDGKPLSAASKGHRVPFEGESLLPETFCEDIKTASVGDGSVTEGCAMSFCTMACKTFMEDECSTHSSPKGCVLDKISGVVPAGHSKYKCSF